MGQKSPPPEACSFLTFVDNRFGISNQFYTPITRSYLYARLQIFIQLSQTLTKLCHIKRDYLVHVICSKCPPSGETHAFRRLRKSLIALLIVICGKSSEICCFYDVNKHVALLMSMTWRQQWRHLLSKQTYKSRSSEVSKIRWVVSLSMA